MKSIALIISLQFLLFNLYSQCLSGNCNDGRGHYRFDKGVVYKGQFKDGRPYGKGKLSTPSYTYMGDFKNGVKEGEGKLTYKKSKYYIGQFHNDLFHGKGKFQFANGDVYKGEWRKGKKNGKGNYIFSNLDSYEGEFANGQINGKGTLITKAGEIKEGTWSNGQLVLTDANPSSQFDDNNSVPAITGHELKDCSKQYCDDTIGKYLYKDGSIYIGEFVDGQPTGEGTCNYANGSTYTGGWKNHGPHGEGLMTFDSGRKFNGVWNYGTPTRQKKVPKQSHKEDYQIAKNKVYDEEVKIFAFISGIASYSHMPSLKYTDDDAYQVYAFLKSPAGGAIPDNRISLLIDDAATKDNILNELKMLSRRADSNDVILVYLSGHGLQGSYIPSDFDGFNNNLPYDELLSIIDNSEAKHKLCIADACHSGSMYAARGITFQGLESYYNQFDKVSSSTAFLTSSKSEEVSLEYSGLRQGVFSHFLIDGLKGNADSDGNGMVTLGELYPFIFTQVQTYTGGAQSPTLSGNYNTDMPVSIARFN